MRVHTSMHLSPRCRLRLIHSKTEIRGLSLVPKASVCHLPIRSIRSLLQTRRFQTSFLRLQRIPPVVYQSRPVFASAVSTTPVHGAKNSLTGISSSTSEHVVSWGGSPITSRHGTGNWVSVTPETRGRTCPSAKSASPGCGRPCCKQILPLRLILPEAFSPETQPGPEVPFM